MNNAGWFLLLVVWLPGCSLFSPKAPDVVIQEKPIAIVCGAVTNKPDALDLQDTPPTIVLGPGEIWGYWFSPDLYAALAENIQALRRYMAQQRRIRDALADCIESHNDQVKETD